MSEQDGGLKVMGVGAKSEESVTIHGLTVPTWFTAVLYRPGRPYSATVYVRVDPATGPVPEGVQVNAPPPAGATFRDAVDLLAGQPLDELLHQAMLMAVRVATWQEGIDAAGKRADGEQAGLEQAMLGSLAQGNRPPPAVRRRLVNQSLLEEVAQVYRAALAEGRPPTQAVAAHFTTTHSSAARWVRESRRAGVLGPSVGPTAGEDVPEVSRG